MEVIINMLLLAVIVVFIIDLSGVIDSLRRWLWKRYIKVGDWHNLSLKPFSCSLCSAFHTNIIYLLFFGHFTLPYIAAACLLAYLTPIIAEVMIYVKDALIYLLNLLYKLIGQ